MHRKTAAASFIGGFHKKMPPPPKQIFGLLDKIALSKGGRAHVALLNRAVSVIACSDFFM